MAVGCYVIGESVIHLSLPIPETPYYAENFVTHFISACEKLSEKLECLVIVDPKFTDPKAVQDLFNIGHEYANFVYIFPAIAAILQCTVSTAKGFYGDKMLIFINVNEQHYVCSLTKEKNLIYPFDIKIESLESLRHPFYLGFPQKNVYCLHQNYMDGELRKALREQFGLITFRRMRFPITILAMGGFYKALCIAESEKQHLEVRNFAPGILNGDYTIVNKCSSLPLKVDYMPDVGISTLFCDVLTVVKAEIHEFKISKFEELLPPQKCMKKYILEYNEFGLLKIDEDTLPLSFSIFNDFLFNLNGIHVWSMKKQCRAIFDIQKQHRQFDPFDDFVKNLFTDELMDSVDQHTSLDGLNNLHVNTLMDSNLHTIFVDKPMENYIAGPRISIAPSYIGILQYFVTYFKPTSPHLIIILITKASSTFYVLAQRSPLCYTVTYMAEYSEMQKLLPSNLQTKTRILYIFEKGINQALSLDLLSINISVTRFELSSNLDEVMFYGGAIYALQNSCSTLSSPYVTINPFFDPADNNCDHLNIIKRSCFYEIEAFFHAALKSTNSSLFSGDIITVLLRRNTHVFIYFFVHVGGKFLFKFDTTVPSGQLIDDEILHYADTIIIEDSEMPKVSKQVTFFKWDKNAGVEEFLKEMKEENLVIFNTQKYSEAFENARENGIFESVIFEIETMVIECKTDKCRIQIDDNQFLAINNEEWIPMYLSFSHCYLRFGYAAIEDSEKSPESVVYDFVKLLGATTNTFSFFDPKWGFELVEMEDSEDPKLGYKIKTFQGFKIFSPEMALTIFLQKLIHLYEKYIGKNVDQIIFKISKSTVLTKYQKESFLDAAKRLKKNCSFY